MNSKQITYNHQFIPDISIYRISQIKDKKEQVAKDVIAGKYGRVDTKPSRRELLAKAGYDYETIQSIVNKMMAGTYKSAYNKTYCNFPVKKVLQSMSFTLSINDITGSFSLTLFPEYEGISVFDAVHIMDIVEIREPCIDGSTNTVQSRPAFIGIVKSRKFVTQTDGNGGMRRVSISGIAATGLVSQFLINLDTSAMALTGQLKEQANLNNELTMSFGGEKNLKVSELVKKVWEHFLNISQQNGTPEIARYIEGTLGSVSEMFDIDDSTFYYPVGCIFKGEQTQDFFSLIDGIVPSPVYEKFAYMGLDGKMKIKIRQVPFDPDKWKNKATRQQVETKLLKSFEISQSDKEVYTVFYAYLNGYPIDEQKSLRLSTLEEKVDDTLIASDEYKIYGYKPLICHFIGYGLKDGEQDSDSPSNMKTVTENLKKWFGNLHKMFSGSMTFAMTYQNTAVIMPGDVLCFLPSAKNPYGEHWAEFYVEGITHNWNYGTGGEISLTVSRGGAYKNGEFLEDETAKMEVGKLSVLMESIQK